MKILKVYVLLVLLLSSLYVVTYFLDRPSLLNEESKQYHSHTNSLSIMNSVEKGEILPQNEWASNINGTWHITYTLVNPTNILDISGEVSINIDKDKVGTHLKFLAYDYYSDFEKIEADKDRSLLVEKGNLFFKGSVYFSGKVKDNEHLVFSEEEIFEENKSSISLSNEKKSYDLNVNYSSPDNLGDLNLLKRILNSSAVIGDYSDVGMEVKLITFTKNKIVLFARIDTVTEPYTIIYERIS